jgi:AraC-like DNA-binding protein
MHILYDTSGVHALERFSYFRSAAVGEFAPVAIGGQPPGRLSAAMVVDQVGDLMVEVFSWESDGQIEARRTPRLIQASDPECFRLLLSVHGGMRMRQHDHVVSFRPRDIALYDTSRPFDTRHLPSSPTTKRVVMVTFPRTLVSGDAGQIDRHVGTVFPRYTRARSQIADLLAELTDPQRWLVDHGDVADVLRECVIGLLRERLGRPGITTRTYRQIQQARIRTIIRDQLGQPALGPAQIARMAHVSPRYLYQILHDAGTTPMALVKQLRLEECRRSLADPALSDRTIKDIALSLGYVRQDQFAHDFKQMFGVSARAIRP